MRVLVLDEWLPVPPDSGKRLRSYELLRRLARRHEITWLAPVDPGEDVSAARTRMERDGFRVETVPRALPERSSLRFRLQALGSLASPLPFVVLRHRARALTRRLGELHAERRFDLLHVEWTPLAANRPTGWDRPWAVVAHNLESRIWRRLSRVAEGAPERLFFALESARMARYERSTFRQAGAVVAVSEAERAEVQALGGRAFCVENGVDLEAFRPIAEGAPEDPVLLFTGALDWQPNQDAVEYFLAAIWPQVRARHPDLRFQVVGRRPGERWKRRMEAQPGVEVCASVPDVRPYLERAFAVVVPLRAGGGTRLKILEALAMEKAVISTPVGAEGLEIREGRDYLAAESPSEWLSAISGLRACPERRGELGRAGRRGILGRYGWEPLSEKLEQVWLALGAPAGPA